MKNNKIIFILFLLISTFVQSQVVRYTYYDDAKKNIKEVFYVKDTISNILDGNYSSYYLNGTLESEGYFKNNKNYGLWNFYYQTGNIKMVGEISDEQDFWIYYYESGAKSMEGAIVDNKREGEWKIYYETENVKEKGIFKNNKRIGEWIGYYEDGNVMWLVEYDQNQVGKYTEYYSSGEIKAFGMKKGIVSTGQWVYYFPNGKIMSEGVFEKGKKNGIWEYYYPNGKIMESGIYKHGKRNGKWDNYYENGALSFSGTYVEDKKDGFWNFFFKNGIKKGETQYDLGNGNYKEYYQSGELRLEGKIVHDVYQGNWKYYYTSGELEGECNFEDGKGVYYGYYPNGKLQTKGEIHQDEKVGRWELYNKKGELSGYYQQINKNDLNNTNKNNSIKKKSNNFRAGTYKYKKKRFTYFTSNPNEFQGIVIGVNPFAAFLGRIPIGLEFYSQERLGLEFEFEVLRNPFGINDGLVSLNKVYTQGYRIALRQKFYNKVTSKYGLWYFGHVFKFCNEEHSVNLTIARDMKTLYKISANEKRLEYLLMLGYRLMKNTKDSGITLDIFVAGGLGYRMLDLNSINQDVFIEKINNNKIPLTYNIGFNFGYVISSLPKR